MDDNIEIALEFAAFNERFGSGSHLNFFHVKVVKIFQGVCTVSIEQFGYSLIILSNSIGSFV